MEFIDLVRKIEQSYSNKIPFAIYKKPNDTYINAFIQQNDSLYHVENYTEKGIVFAPFNNNKKPVIILADKAVHYRVEFVEKTISTSSEIANAVIPETAKLKHLKLVQEGVSFIQQGQAQKIVLSRAEVCSDKDTSLSIIFERLVKNYPEAMSYIWFHPKVGLWAGATPESLCSVENNKFSTMALAGTQPFNGALHIEWHKKEVEEQKFVTEYIVDAIKDEVSNLNIGEPYTMRAGSLVHIRTDIKGELDDMKNMKKIIDKLHPTPAVCGVPKHRSKQFILAHEGYDREYYTGFLGELNFEGATRLFVNLRCMKIEDSNAVIYVGGGITKDSIAENEWLETVEKSNVMKKVLAL